MVNLLLFSYFKSFSYILENCKVFYFGFFALMLFKININEGNLFALQLIEFHF